MSFEIHATDIGPVIVYNGNFLAITNDDAMIELAYEDGNRLKIIQDHIIEEAIESFNTYIEGFKAEINPPAGKLYAYISALQQFWIFEKIRLAQYLAALEQAEEEE